MAKPIKIHRGYVDWTDASTATTHSIPGVSDWSKCFVLLSHAVQSVGAGPPSGTVSDLKTKNLAVAVWADDVSNVLQLRRETTDANRISYEVWEYVGSAGGDYEFVVLTSQEATLLAGNSTITTPITGYTDIDDVAVFTNGLVNNSSFNRVNTFLRASKSGTNSVLTAGSSFGLDHACALQHVEFKGSAWSLQEITDVGMSVGKNAQTISAVDWGETIVISSWSCANNTSGAGLDELGYTVIVDTGNTTSFDIRLRSTVSFPANYTFTSYVLSCDGATVNHYDSVDGSGTTLPAGSASPQTESITITAVSDVDATALLFYADTTGTGTAWPRSHWTSRLTSTTNVDAWRSRYGQTSEWSLHTIEWPDEAISITLSGGELGVAKGTPSVVAVAPTELTPDGGAVGTEIRHRANTIYTPALGAAPAGYTRRQILASVVDSIKTAVTAAGDSVFRARYEAIDSDAIPCVLVHSPEDRSMPRGRLAAPIRIEREMDIIVECVTSGASGYGEDSTVDDEGLDVTVDDAIDSLIDQVEHAILANKNFINFFEYVSDIERQYHYDERDTRRAMAGLRFMVRFGLEWYDDSSADTLDTVHIDVDMINPAPPSGTGPDGTIEVSQTISTS